MKVSELAKELKVDSQDILEKLKTLKLKAKDANQELSAAVANVLRTELKILTVSRQKTMPSYDPVRRPKWDKEEVVKPVKKKVEPKTVKADKSEKPEKVDQTEKLEKEEKIAKSSAKKTAVKEVKTIKEKTPEPKEESPVIKEVKMTANEKLAKKLEQESRARYEDKPGKALLSGAGAQTRPVPPVKPQVSKPVSDATRDEARDKPSVAPVVLPKPKTTTPLIEEPFVTVKPLAKKKKSSFSDQQRGRPFDAGRSAPALGAPLADSVSVPVSTEPQQLQDLEVNLPITVKDLAVRLQQKPSLLLKELMMLGLLGNINQNLDEELVKKLSARFGYNVIKVKTQEEQLVELHETGKDAPEDLAPRPPVITFMGHVDHGKTSLLDSIRKSKVADSEHGGITQHIGAYSVRTGKGTITFLDTPGHEAFTSMRARGAHITDLVVLVVAADEGIMPQTQEAIDHARAAEVPIVVALNKIDKRNADQDKVKKQLASIDLTPEDWGGKTIVVGVSATTGQGIDQLLDMILLEAEILELRANKNKRASGIVVEAHMSQGKGAVTSLIVQNGTLNEGDILVVGPYYGRVKAMFDDHERPIKSAGPSTPVEILGIPEVPEAGEMFYVMEDERQARDIAYKRRDQIKEKRLSMSSKITLEDLYSQIQEGKLKELNVIIKADVQGSLEALIDSFSKIPNDQVKLKIIHTGVGDINSSDILLASASSAIVMGFHVALDNRAKEEMERNPVDVRTYRIIYDAVNDVRNALEGLLEPKTRKKFLARIEVRQVFKLSKSGMVAGCFVQKGRVNRKAHIDVLRNGDVVFSGTISSLKRFKDDVKDVNEGMECGISLNNFTDYQPGDIFEANELERIARKLE